MSPEILFSEAAIGRYGKTLVVSDVVTHAYNVNTQDVIEQIAIWLG